MTAGEDQGKKEKKKKVDFSRYYPLVFTLAFVVILFQYSFSSLEAIFYDLRVKYDFGFGFRDNIVLVTIDEESDQFLGEIYPYTYSSHERLMEKLVVDQPRVVGYLVSLSEPQEQQEKEDLRKFKRHISEFKESGGGFQFGVPLGKDQQGWVLPPNSLRDLGFSYSIINRDGTLFARDDVTRRAVINISGDNSFHLWASNEFRKFYEKPLLDARNVKGSYYDTEADAIFAMFRYYTNPVESKRRIKRIPFHRVMVGNYPKGFFKDKIVLVGSTYIGKVSDFTLTPFNKERLLTSNLTVHAAIIQALFNQKTIYAVPRWVTYFLSFVIAIFLSVTIAQVRPTKGLVFTLAVMFGLVLLSFLLFSILGMWLYTTHLVLTVFVVYYVLVPFRAIGEYQRRYAIQEETKLLKKVENLKQNFISLMSHDLKTPVAKIAGLADIMMQKNRTNNDLVKDLQSIIDSTRELNNFITSILDLTKVESRKLQLNLVSKDINSVIENITQGLRYEASQKSVTIEASLGPLYPIQFDVNLMKRVISNLVENAIKYSGENSVVNIRSHDDDKWVYIEIEDNGVGIPPGDLEHVFEKFYRVKNDASHSIKGSGLGLYLVKYFVELMGGTIIAESEVGQGTKFTVKLRNE